MPKLSRTNRKRVIGGLQAGESAKQMSQALEVHISSIYRLALGNRFQATATAADGPRSA